MDKRELLEKMRTGRAEWEASLAALDDEQLEQANLDGGWSPKIILAHVAWWSWRVGRIFTVLRCGGDTSLPELVQPDVDTQNARIAGESRGLALATVRQAEAAAYAVLLAQVEAASAEELFDPQHFPWTEGRALFNWVEWDTYGHYEEHLPALRGLVDVD